MRSGLRSLASSCLLLLAAAGLQAQDWLGEGTLHGRVTDTEGRAIHGASVELRLAADPSQGPPSTRTDQRGSWRIVRLAPGRYELHIRAEGFINVNGWASVPVTGPAGRIDAQMLSLLWETPTFSGGSPHTLRLWIEKGNSLLEQGHPVEARREYERALAQLPEARQPEVLRGIARSHYLEGRSDLAADTLRRGLEIAPFDVDSRRLYLLLMESEGRAAEAEEFLHELDSRPPVPVAEPAGSVVPLPVEMPEEIERILAAAPEAPEAHRVGDFKIAFSESSPWSRVEDYAHRVKVSSEKLLAEAPGAAKYQLSEESFQVLVPEAYQRGADWGLLVWVSPTPFGGTRNPEMAEALARHRLIWIGANNSGNSRDVWARIWLALDAATNMLELYDIDPERVYIGGYSGGGRTASRMGVLYPELVRGIWALYGCDYYRPLPVAERPGAYYPAKYEPPISEVLELVKSRNRFVLVTGPRDFNFLQTRQTAREMEKDGFEQVAYVEIPGADHHTFPDGEWLDRILTALEPE